jgi:hypothetical protein
VGGAVISSAIYVAAGVATSGAETPSGADGQHPVVPRPVVNALVVEGRADLWGLRLSHLVPGARVRAWSQGFGHPGGPYPVSLETVDEAGDTRTYRIPGGKSWPHRGNPEIILSVSPPLNTEVDEVQVLGRLYFGLLRQNSDGDTVLRRQRGEFCTAVLSRGSRPPPAVNCVTGGNLG